MPKRILVGLCLLLYGASVSFAADAPDLATGIKLYWEAKYREAATALKAVRPDDLSEPERVLLYKFIGLTFFARGDKDAAEEAFTEVLMIKPDYNNLRWSGGSRY